MTLLRVATQRAVHGGLCASLAPASLAFRRDLADPRAAQKRVWRRLQQQWQGTTLAIRHPDLLCAGDPASLADIVDCESFESMTDDVERMALGLPDVRSASPVVRFERSGGSSGSKKCLPQTRAFLAELQRGVGAWLFDLYAHRPGLWSTSAYWSITPLPQNGEARTTAGGIPIGADDDAGYLSGPLQAALHQILVAHPALSRFADIDACRYATWLLLLQRDDLGLLSVWSPTFLTALLAFLDVHADALLRDLAAGTWSPPSSVHSSTASEMTNQAAAADLPLRPLPRRAATLRAAWRREGGLRPAVLWPRLQLVSMWRDGESARFAADVVGRFPGVEVQPKGLLATEGIVTIPLHGAEAPVLCVGSHLYEFLVTTSAGAVCRRLPHELEVGDEAEVVLTTSAGLLRYRLGDRVRVEGFTGDGRGTPCLRFLGRGTQVTDLVGEKLTSAFVAGVLEQGWRDVVGAVAGAPFAMLVPRRDVEPPHYRLYVDDAMTASAARRWAEAVETRLQRAHPYAYARGLGQLDAVVGILVPDAARRYEQACVARGQRVGDIKPVVLSGDDAWHAVFATTQTSDATPRGMLPAVGVPA